MPQTPLVSVLIPLYNKAKYIEKTLQSIDMQLALDKFKLEVIIVDDCSTDNGLEIARNYQWQSKLISNVKIIANETNLGPAVTFNHALDNSTGEYILPFDADDLLVKLSIYVRFLALQDESVDWVSGNVLMIDEEDRFLLGKEFARKDQVSRITGELLVTSILNFKISISAQAIMVKRSAFNTVRWIDEMRSSQDLALFLALALDNQRLLRIDDYVALHRTPQEAAQNSDSLLKRSIASGQKIKDYLTMKQTLKFTEEHKLLIDKIIEERLKKHPLYTADKL
jgi:glycosyltransferase involved in cell wall biosynthesis